MDMTGATWRKSSYSGSNGGACVEAGALWRRSSYSGGNGGACVEAGRSAGAVAVRDSKDPDGPKLTFPADEWRTFTRHLKSGPLPPA